MVLPTIATVADLETRMGVAVGSLAGLDLARAQADLSDASVLIRNYADRAWIAADGTTITAPEAVIVVCVRAAYRSYRNQEELSNVNYGGAYSWGTQDTGVYLTEDEKDIVSKAVTAGEPGPGGSWNGTGSVRTPSAYFDYEADKGATLYGGYGYSEDHFGYPYPT